MFFYTSQGYYAARVYLYFTSTPQYEIYRCNSDKNDFSTSLPAADDKVWRITKTTTSGIRLQIHCNDVEVLDILISDTTCSDGFWGRYWPRDVEKIYFPSDDTASDYYRPYLGPGARNQLKISNKHHCLYNRLND